MKKYTIATTFQCWAILNTFIKYQRAIPYSWEIRQLQLAKWDSNVKPKESELDDFTLRMTTASDTKGYPNS